MPQKSVEARRLYQASWREKNRERVRALMRAWRAEHREYLREYARKRRLDPIHYEHRRLYMQNRRRKVQGLPPLDIPLPYRERGDHRATKVPSSQEIAWAAGIIEGEGSFTVSSENWVRVMVSQKDPEILFRLQEILGGTVSLRHVGGTPKWQCHGARARGVTMTIYKFLSQRRKTQARKLLPWVAA